MMKKQRLSNSITIEYYYVFFEFFRHLCPTFKLITPFIFITQKSLSCVMQPETPIESRAILGHLELFREIMELQMEYSHQSLLENKHHQINIINCECHTKNVDDWCLQLLVIGTRNLSSKYQFIPNGCKYIDQSDWVRNQNQNDYQFFPNDKFSKIAKKLLKFC